MGGNISKCLQRPHRTGKRQDPKRSSKHRWCGSLGFGLRRWQRGHGPLKHSDEPLALDLG